MKDAAGNTLVPGDFVAYGARSGNSGALRLGIIANPEKQSIITGNFRRVYDINAKAYSDEYTFECSGVPGHGVDGDKLLKLPPEIYPGAYEVLYEKAQKYL